MVASGAFVAGPWRYARVEDAGHWLQLDRPDAVNELLLDFLHRTGRPPGAGPQPRRATAGQAAEERRRDLLLAAGTAVRGVGVVRAEAVQRLVSVHRGHTSSADGQRAGRVGPGSGGPRPDSRGRAWCRPVPE